MMVSRGFGKLALALMVTGVAATVHAAPIALVNGGFESQTIADNAYDGGVVTSWVDSGANAGLFGGTTDFGGDGLEGSNTGLLVTTASAPTQWMANFVNTATATIQDDTRYTVSLLLGAREAASIPAPDSFSLEVRGKRSGSGAQDVLDLVSFTGTPLSNGVLTEWTAVFDTPDTDPALGGPWAGRQIVIYIEGQYGASGVSSKQLAIDNVRLDAALIPEPGSLALLAAGCLALASRRRSSKAVS